MKALEIGPRCPWLIAPGSGRVESLTWSTGGRSASLVYFTVDSTEEGYRRVHFQSSGSDSALLSEKKLGQL